MSGERYVVDFLAFLTEYQAAWAKKVLTDELAWLRLKDVPRLEYYVNRLGTDLPYTYGRGLGERTYTPQPSHWIIDSLFETLEKRTGVHYDVCFLNRYLDQRDQLGWHADDSPMVDHDRPIAVISLGAERELWWKLKIDQENAINKIKLADGSLFVMGAGMQRTHVHRIPKAGFVCGERISLTFRGYVSKETRA